MTTQSRSKKASRKRYLPEFKAEALALTGKLGVPQAAKELETYLASALHQGLRLSVRSDTGLSME